MEKVFDTDGVDYKGRLERKMCLARENPEPIFDLAQCRLRAVPSGVYSLCRVLRKEALFLQENLLTCISGVGIRELTLLKILDIHGNNITKLPDEIGFLVNLELLNVSDNKLVSLPESIGQAVSLETLLVSKNRLKKIPLTLLYCTGLKKVDLTENNELKLPAQFSTWIQLGRITCDKQFGMKKSVSCEEGCSLAAVDSQYLALQDKLEMIQQQKDLEKDRRLAWEKSLLNNDDDDSVLQLVYEKRTKITSQLLKDVKSMNESLDAELKKIHKMKESETSQLIIECLKAEELVNQSVRQIIKNAEKTQRNVANEITLPVVDQSRLDAKKIIEDMHEKLQREFQRVQEYGQQMLETRQNWIFDNYEISRKFSELAVRSKNEKLKLIEALSCDEELQKAAVAVLLENSDARCWQLTQQVAAIEKQLGQLTRNELKRRAISRDNHMVELSMSRLTLTKLLVDALAQQTARRQQLLKVIDSSKPAHNNNHWLETYRQLDCYCRQMTENIRKVDFHLQNEFLALGVVHCLPVISHLVHDTSALAFLKDFDLLKAGIENADDRQLILKAISNYLEVVGSRPAPSAPLPPSEPSAPLEEEEDECIVCMDRSISVVFVPCGHTCCCISCSSLDSCPLCRAQISSTVPIQSR